jgi:hypothetical protein
MNEIYSANGLRFKGNNRPVVREVGKNEYMIHVDGRHLVIDKENIDDLILLLEEVKVRNYKIKEDVK